MADASHCRKCTLIERAYPRLVRELLESPRPGRPDRVDQCVDFAPRLVDLSECGSDFVVLGCICSHGEDCASPGLLHRVLGQQNALAVTAEDGNASTSGGEALGY